MFQEAFETSPWRRLLKGGWKGPTKWANQPSPASSTVEPPWAGCHTGAHQMLGWLLPSWHGFRNNNYYILYIYDIFTQRLLNKQSQSEYQKKQNAIRTFWCETLIISFVQLVGIPVPIFRMNFWNIMQTNMIWVCWPTLEDRKNLSNGLPWWQRETLIFFEGWKKAVNWWQVWSILCGFL